MNFSINSPLYYLTAYHKLSRLDVILMVRKISKKVHGGGSCPAPFLCLILEHRRLVRSESFFMDRCPKDEPAAKNLVCKENSLYSREKLEKRVGGGIHPPGHQGVE